jgi:hypothetical protein
VPLPPLELFIFFQEQPLLIQDLLEQEKREQQQQQQQPASSLLMGQPQQQQQPLDPPPTMPGTDPLGRPPMMPMRQYPAAPHAGSMHPMMGPRLPAAPMAAAPVPGGGWPPRHPQEVTLQQRSPHQMMVPHQVPVTNTTAN